MQKLLLKVLTVLLFYLPLCAQSQTKIVQGEVLDKQSDEPIPFVSIRFLLRGGGELTDSLGHFSISLNNISSKDTLQITSVGYTPLQIPVTDLKDSLFITRLPSRPRRTCKVAFSTGFTAAKT